MTLLSRYNKGDTIWFVDPHDLEKKRAFERVVIDVIAGRPLVRLNGMNTMIDFHLIEQHERKAP